MLALVGGRDHRQSQFDRATQARRQPGSAFKPVVALAALSRSATGTPTATLATLLEDEPLLVEAEDEEDEDWEPANYDGEFRGAVSLREALEMSLNVPIARLGIELGPERIVRTARRLGLQGRLRPVPSLALGAFEVSLLELVEIYAVLASGGVRVESRLIESVQGREGATLERRRSVPHRVFEPDEVFLVTSALEGAIERGTGSGLRARGYPGSVAGKTGTSNDYRDAWFVGYTPGLVVGVWVGFDDGESLGLTGAGAALPIFGDLVTAAGPSWTDGELAAPPGLERVSVHEPSGLRAGPGCRGEPEWFLEGTAPEGRCRSAPVQVLERANELLHRIFGGTRGRR